MLVNGIDVTIFNAMFLTKDIQSAKTVIFSDWLRQSINPLYMGKTVQFKVITVNLLVKDVDDNSALTDISNLEAQFDECIIKFDGLDYYYYCLISDKKHTRARKGWYQVTITLNSAYAYKDLVTETMNSILSKTINVSGNLPTPAIITVTPTISMSSVTLTGFGADPITINNLTANTPIIIDGEACTVTQNGANKFGDTDMWEFPVLQPGSNTITVDNTNCTVQIQYKPKWL